MSDTNTPAQNTKAQQAEQKLRFETHVNLIQIQDKLPKSKATFTAWLEGPGGLARRLPSPVAPK